METRIQFSLEFIFETLPPLSSFFVEVITSFPPPGVVRRERQGGGTVGWPQHYSPQDITVSL